MAFWPLIPWDAQRRVDETIAKKQGAREASIRKALELTGTDAANKLTKEDEAYVRAGVAEITSKVRSKEWKCKDVTVAFIRSAARAHKNTNCLTEILFEDAIKEAQELDGWIQTASQEELDQKLLLGVPVSLKDMIHVKGYDSSIGFVRYAYPAPNRSPLALHVD